jgi:hAT family C-terminal dimerisation region
LIKQVTQPSEPTAVVRSEHASTICNQPPMKRFKLLSEDLRSRATSHTTRSTSGLDAELQLYLGTFGSQHTEHSQDTNGLRFWVEHSTQFPLLSPLAMDLLAAPASEAYVERVFSVCGDLTAGKRNRMMKGLENRAFLKMNIKFYTD